MNKALSAKPENISFLQGVNDIVNSYDAFILDIWGVLHDGLEPFAGTVHCLEKLQKAGKAVCLLSNTPESSDRIVSRLETMGIGRTLYQQIVTAGDSAHRDIQRREGKSCWYAGNNHATCLLRNVDLNVLDHPEGADFVINDLYDLDTVQKQAVRPLLRIAADNNLPMICGNPDLVVNVGKDLKECPGTYALIYEEMGGKVIYHGKPHRPVYEEAWTLLGRPDKSRMVAIGDSLHTDIQGAGGFGIDSVFNVSGIHSEELDAAEGLSKMVSGQPHRPVYFMQAFVY